MKKLISILMVVLCAGVIAFGDVFAAPVKLEKVNGVARMTHSGDITGTFNLLSVGCITNTDALDLQVLVYVPGVSIVARPVADLAGNYTFTLYNVPAGTVEVRIDVLDATGLTLTTLTLPGTGKVTVLKQTVNKLNTFVPVCPPAPQP